MSPRARKLVVALVGVPIALAGALVALGATYAPRTSLPPGTLGERKEIGGVRLRIEQRGTGPDVLLLHGSPGSLEDWEPVMSELAATHRVTRFDRPGNGWSDAAGAADYEGNAAIVLQTIRALGLHDVVLVGHSFGGTVGLVLAEQGVPELTGLVVVASRGYSMDRPSMVIRLVSTPLFGLGLTRVTGGALAASLIEQGLQQKWHPNENLIPPGFVEARVALWSEPRNSVTAARERLVSRDAIARRYGDIHSKVVVVMGTDDHPNADEAPRMVSAIPGARLTWVAGAGHYVQFVRPDVVVAAIAEAR